ncbi:MAG: hypothetical protein Hyperionvirus34_19 [Hyperionvirus sp.]|uniref:Uncharacterized protein n=1 Tax=Hyperionvirus sp. TaxID=2487770 RepID=A0A3G5ABV0_9VIRU|nr:MAG: hypothetical protein Hyperionvirus34_19 [Hyperionvirus sp.]
MAAEESKVSTHKLIAFAGKHCGMTVAESSCLPYHLKQLGVVISRDADGDETVSGSNTFLWNLKLNIEDYNTREKKVRALLTDIANKLPENLLRWANTNADEKRLALSGWVWITEKEFASFIPGGSLLANFYRNYDGSATCSTYDHHVIVAIDVDGKRCYLQWLEMSGGDYGDLNSFGVVIRSTDPARLSKISLHYKTLLSTARFFPTFAALEKHYDQTHSPIIENPLKTWATKNPLIITRERTRAHL